MAPNINHDAATMVTKQRLMQHDLFLHLKDQRQPLQTDERERVVLHQYPSKYGNDNGDAKAEARQDTNGLVSSSTSLGDPATAAVARALKVHATADSVMNALLDEQWSTVEALCRKHPSLVASQLISMVCQGENTTCLPVHFCCGRKSAPLSTIEALVAAHDEGSRCLMTPESSAGRLPLHLAVLKGAASLTVVEYLCRAAPESLRVADHEGNLPLHYAAMHASDAVVRLLVQSYPPACHEANAQSQRLPLHLLCARSWGGCDPQHIVSLETIRSVVQEHPEALRKADRRGRLPLHVHCASDPRADVLQVLVEQCPEALLQTDHSNAKWTPLALARKFTTTLESSSSSNNDTNTSKSTTTNGSSNVVLAYLIEMTNKERRKKYKFLAPLQAVGGKIVAARRRATKPDPEALHLHYCYG